MSEKLINLYISKYIKGSLNFNGIKLIPEIVNNGDYLDNKKLPKIYWLIENPNDLSYSQVAIQNFIVDSIYDFYKVSGQLIGEWLTTVRFITNNYVKFYNIESVYISKKLESKIDKTIAGIHSFTELNTGWKSEYEILVYDISSHGSDEIRIESRVELRNTFSTRTNEKLTPDVIRDKFDKMENNDDFIGFVDRLLNPIADIIWNTITITDRDSMYISTNCEFLDEEGEVI